MNDDPEPEPTMFDLLTAVALPLAPIVIGYASYNVVTRWLRSADAK